jgi:hypothetical protein
MRMHIKDKVYLESRLLLLLCIVSKCCARLSIK